MLEMETSNILFAFALTLFAGLATGLGSVIAFFSKRTNEKFLSFSLGFSAGVMIYVSFIEIVAKAKEYLIADLGIIKGNSVTALAFFGGMGFIMIIDMLIPEFENPHEVRRVEDIDIKKVEKQEKLKRMGIFSALAIAIHNFPEGLATFTSALTDSNLGIAIAVAIAIHNIPEGIAVSVPVFYSTGSRKKAFGYSFLSGLAEPLGASIGFLILMPFMTNTVFGILFAAVAGIMVFISLDELLPTAQEYGEHHLAIYGLIAGMIIMAITLIMFL